MPLFLRLFTCLALLFLLSANSFAVSLSIPKGDDVILAQMQNNISKVPALAQLPIQISVDGGVVTLSGVVGSKHKLLALIVLADSITGVQRVVVSDILFGPGYKPPSEDEIIQAEVEGTFNREGLMGPTSKAPINTAFSGSNIGTSFVTYTTPAPVIDLTVKVKKGVVYLMGSVPDQATLDRASGLAQGIYRVDSVDSSGVKVVAK